MQDAISKARELQSLGHLRFLVVGGEEKIDESMRSKFQPFGQKKWGQAQPASGATQFGAPSMGYGLPQSFGYGQPQSFGYGQPSKGTINGFNGGRGHGGLAAGGRGGGYGGPGRGGMFGNAFGNQPFHASGNPTFPSDGRLDDGMGAAMGVNKYAKKIIQGATGVQLGRRKKNKSIFAPTNIVTTNTTTAKLNKVVIPASRTLVYSAHCITSEEDRLEFWGAGVRVVEDAKAVVKIITAASDGPGTGADVDASKLATSVSTTATTPTSTAATAATTATVSIGTIEALASIDTTPESIPPAHADDTASSPDKKRSRWESDCSDGASLIMPPLHDKPALRSELDRWEASKASAAEVHEEAKKKLHVSNYCCYFPVWSCGCGGVV